jgi:hypothetical protein
MIRIELFSRKRFGRRRQYYARIVEEQSEKQSWRTSEGYNNRGDRQKAVDQLTNAGLQAHIVDLDRLKHR